MVCRQGGDEFVILLAEIEQPQDAAHIAEKLLDAFIAPHIIGESELHVTLSIGISVYPDDGDNVDNAMQNADTAMFHAKAIGRNNYQFFRADMNVQAVRRMSVETSLRRALKNDEFVLEYQPQIDLASGAMIGAEALIRWQTPDYGLVYPAQFIPIAEASSLIVPIGQWVLREACAHAQSWIESGLPPTPVSVNFSAFEFRSKGFIKSIRAILDETHLHPRYLEVELTESALMRDAGFTNASLMTLKALGVRLAIDDFGTGYSSLSYLKRLPIHTLKIDQSFLEDMANNPRDVAVVRSIIELGHNLDCQVVAEGVEDEIIRQRLQDLGCDLVQGFHISKPLPNEGFGEWLSHARH
jgi:predicted signal transduction protein with EAL and GGDEF domain